MATVLQSSLGGAVEHDGGRRLRCRYPGRLVTALLLVLASLWSFGAALMVVGGALDRDPGVVVFGSLGVLAVGGVILLVRFRVRRMGTVEVDADAGTIVFSRSRAERGRWPLAEVTFTRVWDPFHRGFGFFYWLVARVPDGRGLRLAKGTAVEIDYLLRVLRDWGLRVGPR